MTSEALLIGWTTHASSRKRTSPHLATIDLLSSTSKPPRVSDRDGSGLKSSIPPFDAPAVRPRADDARHRATTDVIVHDLASPGSGFEELGTALY